jgi:hypothetical protein
MISQRRGQTILPKKDAIAILNGSGKDINTNLYVTVELQGVGLSYARRGERDGPPGRPAWVGPIGP